MIPSGIVARVAYTLSVALTILGALDLYWAFGGTWGFAASLGREEINASRALRISAGAVAIALLVAAGGVLGRVGLWGRFLPWLLFSWRTWALAAALFVASFSINLTARWESWPVTRYVFAGHVALYRLFGGRWVGKHTLILTTTGRKSGRQRSTPLLYVRDGGDYIIVASNGGEDRYPGWWHNIRQNPNVQIQVGRKIIACRAVRASGEAAPRLWAKLTAVYDGYRTYRGRTQRELTIFRLTPELPGHGLGEG